MSPSDTPEVGRRFRVVEVLGRGGFGVVYRAEATSHGGFTKQVALKVLRKDVDLSGGVAERLRDEARILGLLRHRAIVKVDGLVELENGWAVVMEYVPGVNLSSLVKHGCTARAATEIIAEVAGALHAAWHDVNDVTGEPLHLVHRDIKPANIRVTSQGEVKVLDFGVARADFDDREAETVSVLFGSMRYMAPERLDGIEGPSSDVYALGLVFAELLTGQRFGEPPKHPGRHEEWARKVLDAVEDAVAEEAEPEIIDALSDLFGLTLAYEPTPRPSAAQIRSICRAIARKLPSAGLAEFAETEIPELERRVGEARARRLEGDAVDSVLIEHGSQSMRAEVTGITRSRALVGGVMAGAGLLSISGAVVGILLLLGGVWWWGSTSPETVATGPVETPAAEPRPPKLVTTPRPKPAEPVPVAPEAPEPQPAAPRRPAPRRRPDPKPAAGSTTLTLTGDLASARLVGASSANLSAGGNQVPPGSYAVHAAFDGGELVEVSRISVPEGPAVLHCSQMLYTCRIQ